jgi:hypothetical protein
VEAREQRIAFLEGKLKKKDEVLAEPVECSAEFVPFKLCGS